MMQLSKRAMALTISLQVMLSLSVGTAGAADGHSKGGVKPAAPATVVTEDAPYDQSNPKNPPPGFRPNKLYGPGMEKNELYNTKDLKGFRQQKLYGPGMEKNELYNTKDLKGFRQQKLYGPGMEKNDLYNTKDLKGFRQQKLYGPQSEKISDYNKKDLTGFRQAHVYGVKDATGPAVKGTPVSPKKKASTAKAPVTAQPSAAPKSGSN